MVQKRLLGCSESWRNHLWKVFRRVLLSLTKQVLYLCSHWEEYSHQEDKRVVHANSQKLIELKDFFFEDKKMIFLKLKIKSGGITWRSILFHYTSHKNHTMISRIQSEILGDFKWGLGNSAIEFCLTAASAGCHAIRGATLLLYHRLQMPL